MVCVATVLPDVVGDVGDVAGVRGLTMEGEVEVEEIERHEPFSASSSSSDATGESLGRMVAGW